MLRDEELSRYVRIKGVQRFRPNSVVRQNLGIFLRHRPYPTGMTRFNVSAGPIFSRLLPPSCCALLRVARNKL